MKNINNRNSNNIKIKNLNIRNINNINNMNSINNASNTSIKNKANKAKNANSTNNTNNVNHMKYYYHYLFIIFIFLISFASNLNLNLYALAEESRFVTKRLDPHGNKNDDLKKMSLKEHSKCRTCHSQAKGKINLRSNVNNTCASCHNDYPHSGLKEEHLNKDLNKLKEINLKGKITCLSCHRAHRAYLPDDPRIPDLETRKKPSFLYKPLSTDELPEGLVDRRGKEAMLKRACDDCHKW